MVETVYRLDLPCSLALLGDLHGRPYQKVIESLRKHRPEIITIAGDILYGKQPPEDISPLVSQTCVLSFLHECCSVAPTFLSLGNHEWMLDEKDFREIQSTGVTILDNIWVGWQVDDWRDFQ